ncbi:MAG TPA: TetR family transcriptional regulator [Ktedonosporobacter sp.]|nr:TetR family transcriptional regulator [Ktedonosporobacter sp.]
MTTTKAIDPRVKRTRKLLQQAFMELFQEKSFSSISIQDITERATVNRATFYAHFPDKYALLDSIIREQFQEAMIDKLPPSPNWGVRSLRRLIQAVFDYLGAFHRDCRPSDTQFDPLIERAIQQELADILLGWLKQANGSGARSRVRMETMASVMSWAIFGTAVQWSRSTRTPEAEEMTAQVLLVLTEGGAHLAPPLLPE